MCMICVEYNKTKDLADMARMIQYAVNEPGAVDEEHLAEVVNDWLRLSNLKELFSGVINGTIPHHNED